VLENGQTDLNRVIQEQKPMSEVAVRYFFREMLTCIDMCHQHNIIHLDLKPANFVIVNGRLKIIDFGIAKTVDSNMTGVIRDTAVSFLGLW